jgi:transcriptional regulator with XRE-family HTH domain
MSVTSPATSADTTALPVVLPASDRAALGMLLSEARRAAGMTQRQLELASGVPQGKISRVERGQSYPALLTLTQIASALGLELTLQIIRTPAD